MMKTQVLGVLAAAAIVAGCAEMKELDDWAMKKAIEARAPAPVATYERGGSRLVSGSASCTFGPGYPKEEHCCVMDRRESAMDVDTAFAKVTQEYRYHANIDMRGKNLSRLYRHQKFPGKLYVLADDVVPLSNSALGKGFWMIFRLEPFEKGVVTVETSYCPSPGVQATDWEGWHKAVQDSVHATLPPLQGRR